MQKIWPAAAPIPPPPPVMIATFSFSRWLDNAALPMRLTAFLVGYGLAPNVRAAAAVS
jgi:hypothetical protein